RAHHLRPRQVHPHRGARRRRPAGDPPRDAGGGAVIYLDASALITFVTGREPYLSRTWRWRPSSPTVPTSASRRAGWGSSRLFVAARRQGTTPISWRHSSTTTMRSW